MTADTADAPVAATACAEPDCEACAAVSTVLDTGAKVLCDGAGGDYDTLTDQLVRDHYRRLAGDAFEAMSQALLDTGLVTAKGEPSDG